MRALRSPRVWAIVGLVTLLLACAGPVVAERLPIRVFSSGDGLGSAFVSQIFQDLAGYVWLATRDGLSRWNGYEFATFSQKDGLAVSAVARVSQTRAGEYLVITNDGVLYSYRPSAESRSRDKGRVVFRPFSVRIDGQEARFTRLYESPSGVLWGGCHGRVIRGVGSTNTPIALASPTSRRDGLVVTQAFVEDRSGTVWVGTNVGLYRVGADGQVAHFQISPRPQGDSIDDLAVDGSGRLWIGHGWQGLLVLDPGVLTPSKAASRLALAPVSGQTFALATTGSTALNVTAKNGLPHDHVTCLLVASNGHVWIGTPEGLARYDGSRITAYTKRHGLCDNLIHALSEDGDGNLWVATPAGAMRIVLDGLSGYTTSEGLSADRITALGETASGSLYAVGIDWSVNVFDGRSFRASQLPLPAGSSMMWASQAAYRDRNDRWWGLTSDGLYRFRATGREPRWVFSLEQRYTVREGLPSSKAFRVYQDRAGTVFVSTRSGDPLDDGLAMLDVSLSRAVGIGTADGLPRGLAPSAFVEDRLGQLWIGFYQGGLARRANGRLRVFGRGDGIPSGMVTGLLVDARGRLWMSTSQSGIGVADNVSADVPRFRMITTEDGLASNNVRAITADRQGRVIAGSVRGVDRLDPSTGRIRHYGNDEGLANDVVTAAYCDARGDVWIGTFGGLFRLMDGNAAGDTPPPIAVTGVRVAGVAYPVFALGEQDVGRLVLDADQRDIAIDFVSVSRREGHGVSYEYSVDGVSGPWTTVNRARSVNFARLQPGDYVFAVRAVTAGRQISSRPATVTLTIRPPIWQRWWFVVLAASVVATGLLGGYRYRVGRLLEMERLRMRIASDLHDDVATNLGSIAMFGALVRSEVQTPSPFLDRITALATESVDSIREIIWSIDPKPETVGTLLVRLHDSMVTSCRARGIRLSVAEPPADMNENLTPEQRKNLSLMLKEAVANAVRHSSATEVTVSVTRAGRRVRMTVSDNGQGLPAVPTGSGRGMSTMRARAEALGGRCEIDSSPERGTTVEFIVL
jgi:ligand-binding sensor domain-containing protein